MGDDDSRLRSGSCSSNSTSGSYAQGPCTPLNMLSVEEVSQLLKAIGMGEHAAAFAANEVDGECLSYCDDEGDLIELGVATPVAARVLLQIVLDFKLNGAPQRLLEVAAGPSDDTTNSNANEAVEATPAAVSTELIHAPRSEIVTSALFLQGESESRPSSDSAHSAAASAVPHEQSADPLVRLVTCFSTHGLPALHTAESSHHQQQRQRQHWQCDLCRRGTGSQSATWAATRHHCSLCDITLCSECYDVQHTSSAHSAGSGSAGMHSSADAMPVESAPYAAPAMRGYATAALPPPSAPPVPTAVSEAVDAAEPRTVASTAPADSAHAAYLTQRPPNDPLPVPPVEESHRTRNRTATATTTIAATAAASTAVDAAELPAVIDVHVHHHQMRICDRQSDGWACDARWLPGGCRSGCTGFRQLRGHRRWRCERCDYDLCDGCVAELCHTPIMRNADGDRIYLGSQRAFVSVTELNGVCDGSGLRGNRVFYCGQLKNECRCGSCDGRCGPENGCPCSSCLMELMSRSYASSASTPTYAAAYPAAPASVAGLPDFINVSDHYHTLKRFARNDGWACDGRHLPGGCRSGCTDFRQLTHQMHHRWRCMDGCDYDLCGRCVEALRRPVQRNADGAEVHFGSGSSWARAQRLGLNDRGGFAGLRCSEVYFCGRQQHQCRCGRCDGRCGPTNGCPCDACLALLHQEHVDVHTAVATPTARGSTELRNHVALSTALQLTAVATAAARRESTTVVAESAVILDPLCFNHHRMIFIPTDTEEPPSSSGSGSGGGRSSGSGSSNDDGSGKVDSSAGEDGASAGNDTLPLTFSRGDVGKVLRVWWPRYNRYFYGRIAKYDSRSCIHTVCYEDGDVRAYNMRTTSSKVQVIDVPKEVFRGASCTSDLPMIVSTRNMHHYHVTVNLAAQWHKQQLQSANGSAAVPAATTAATAGGAASFNSKLSAAEDDDYVNQHGADTAAAAAASEGAPVADGGRLTPLLAPAAEEMRANLRGRRCWTCTLCGRQPGGMSDARTAFGSYSCLPCRADICIECFTAESGACVNPTDEEGHVMRFTLHRPPLATATAIRNAASAAADGAADKHIWRCVVCLKSGKVRSGGQCSSRFFCLLCRQDMCSSCASQSNSGNSSSSGYGAAATALPLESAEDNISNRRVRCDSTASASVSTATATATVASGGDGSANAPPAVVPLVLSAASVDVDQSTVPLDAAEVVACALEVDADVMTSSLARVGRYLRQPVAEATAVRVTEVHAVEPSAASAVTAAAYLADDYSQDDASDSN